MRASLVSILSSLFVVLVVGCAPRGQRHASTTAPPQIRYIVRAIELRNVHVGLHSATHPWLLQDLELAIGPDGKTVARIEGRSGSFGIVCPNGALAYGVQACVTREESERLAREMTHTVHEYAGLGRWRDGAFLFTLTRAGADPLELRCVPTDQGYTCDVASGWPTTWGFTAPVSIALTRA